MQTKQSFSDIKNQIIKDRLKKLFKKNPSSIAKILAYFMKKAKDV